MLLCLSHYISHTRTLLFIFYLWVLLLVKLFFHTDRLDLQQDSLLLQRHKLSHVKWTAWSKQRGGWFYSHQTLVFMTVVSWREEVGQTWVTVAHLLLWGQSMATWNTAVVVGWSGCCFATWRFGQLSPMFLQQIPVQKGMIHSMSRKNLYSETTKKSWTRSEKHQGTVGID